MILYMSEILPVGLLVCGLVIGLAVFLRLFHMALSVDPSMTPRLRPRQKTSELGAARLYPTFESRPNLTSHISAEITVPLLPSTPSISSSNPSDSHSNYNHNHHTNRKFAAPVRSLCELLAQLNDAPNEKVKDNVLTRNMPASFLFPSAGACAIVSQFASMEFRVRAAIHVHACVTDPGNYESVVLLQCLNVPAVNDVKLALNIP
eukprot:c13651_g1_i1.p1 GENE.c13651_g1_i1~~c13651_g1_i1.p1  ORF type:complete len:205 (-),score=55.07 c13651_g1_i1:134-748(-)